MRTLSVEEVRALGLEIETEPPQGRPDPGWDYNPGREGLEPYQPESGKFSDELVSIAKSAAIAAGASVVGTGIEIGLARAGVPLVAAKAISTAAEVGIRTWAETL